MPVSNLCIICYKTCPKIQYGIEPKFSKTRCDSKRRVLILDRFFKLFASHLVKSVNHRLTETLRKLNNSGFLQSCPDCFPVLESFCDIYHKMRKAELMLQWRMETLAKIIRCAQQDERRLNRFKKGLKKQTGVALSENEIEAVLSYKSRMEKECNNEAVLICNYFAYPL